MNLSKLSKHNPTSFKAPRVPSTTQGDYNNSKQTFKNNPSMVDLKLKLNKTLHASIWGFYKPTLKSLDSNPNTCISTQMRLKRVLKTNLHPTYTYILT